MIKYIDSIVYALSLYISKPDDVIRYEEAYSELRDSLRKKHSIFQEYDLDRMPNNLDFNLKYQFALIFPKEFNIPTWCVSDVELPTIHRCEGQKTFSSLRVKLYEPIGSTFTDMLLGERGEDKDYPVIFQRFNNQGEVIRQMRIVIDSLVTLSFSDCRYSQSGSNYTEITLDFNVSNLTIDW